MQPESRHFISPLQQLLMKFVVILFLLCAFTRGTAGQLLGQWKINENYNNNYKGRQLLNFMGKRAGPLSYFNFQFLQSRQQTSISLNLLDRAQDYTRKAEIKINLIIRGQLTEEIEIEDLSIRFFFQDETGQGSYAKLEAYYNYKKYRIFFQNKFKFTIFFEDYEIVSFQIDQRKDSQKWKQFYLTLTISIIHVFLLAIQLVLENEMPFKRINCQSTDEIPSISIQTMGLQIIFILGVASQSEFLQFHKRMDGFTFFIVLAVAQVFFLIIIFIVTEKSFLQLFIMTVISFLICKDQMNLNVVPYLALLLEIHHFWKFITADKDQRVRYSLIWEIILAAYTHFTFFIYSDAVGAIILSFLFELALIFIASNGGLYRSIRKVKWNFTIQSKKTSIQQQSAVTLNLCSVCYKPILDDIRQHTILPCSHYIHHQCLGEIQSKQAFGAKITVECPIDSKEMTINADNKPKSK